jgi:hypothetical protein
MISNVGWMAVDHLPLRDLGPYVIMFMNVCVVITVAMVMLLRDLGACKIIFTIVCYYFRFSRHTL